MFYYGDNDVMITKTIERLPTLLRINKATLKHNKLKITYELVLDKYLPDTGSLYIPRIDLYCIFDTTDDKYWYKCVELTYNDQELNKNKIDELHNNYCILLNDFDIKLDNKELIELTDFSNYRDYAHIVLEKLFLEEEANSKIQTTKATRNIMHKKLEDKLKNIHD